MTTGTALLAEATHATEADIGDLLHAAWVVWLDNGHHSLEAVAAVAVRDSRPAVRSLAAYAATEARTTPLIADALAQEFQSRWREARRAERR